MKAIKNKKSFGSILLIFLLSALPVYASSIKITVDTSALAGTQANLAIDLIDGGLPSNTVTISGFATNGSLGSASSTGDVTGTFPGAVTLVDTSFFNEYLQHATLGTSLSFVFDDTGISADGSSFPDGFSFFLLDPVTALPLAHTSDPTGADALFLLNIGTSTGLETYTSDSVRVTAQLVSVPAPNPAWLLVVGIVMLGMVVLVLKQRHNLTASPSTYA